ncbi:MAG: tol-pal system-associated acyl-CoA thioesterase [Magnetococcales bacterium]|nr:tol-pal system-associated acyl-CoA thioesterase [Magnetococcales bacterium]
MTTNPHHWPVRVYYEDTDAAGVVYHAGYLRFMERGRTEWLRARGIDQGRWYRETGLMFAVAHMEIAFQGPSRMDDALQVVTRMETIRRASVHFSQEIVRVVDREVLIRAVVRVACIDAHFRPRRLPEALRASLVAVESQVVCGESICRDKHVARDKDG